MQSYFIGRVTAVCVLVFRLAFILLLAQGEDAFFNVDESENTMVCKREDLVCDKMARKCFKTKYCRTMRFSPPRAYLKTKKEAKDVTVKISGESRTELFMSDDEREALPLKPAVVEEDTNTFCKREDLVCYRESKKCFPTKFCWSMKFTPGNTGIAVTTASRARIEVSSKTTDGALSAPRANPFATYSKPVEINGNEEKPRPLSAPRANLGNERFGGDKDTGQLVSAPRDDMVISTEIYCKRADLACETGSRQCFRTKYCGSGQFEPPGQSAPDAMQDIESIVRAKAPSRKEVVKWGDDDDDNVPEDSLPREWMGDQRERVISTAHFTDPTVSGEELKQGLINALGGTYAAKAWAQLEYSGVSLGGAPGSIAVRAGPLIPSMWLAKKQGELDGSGYAYGQVSFANSAPLTSSELSQLLKHCPTDLKHIGRMTVLNVQACDLGPDAAGPLVQFIEIAAWTPRAQLWLDSNPKLRASVAAISRIQKAADARSVSVVW